MLNMWNNKTDIIQEKSKDMQLYSRKRLVVPVLQYGWEPQLSEKQWNKNIRSEGKYSSCEEEGFHGGDYEEWCLLGCYTVWLL
jgi:hypothetical protein